MSGTGFADSPSGDGLAGIDPTADPITRVVPNTMRAAKFDVSTKSFPFNASGQLIVVHPVDQQVQLALGTEYGKMPACPTVGNRLREVANNSSEDAFPKAAEAEVNRALAKLLTNGDITIQSVNSAEYPLGRAVTEVRYVNNRTRTTQTVTKRIDT